MTPSNRSRRTVFAATLAASLAGGCAEDVTGGGLGFGSASATAGAGETSHGAATTAVGEGSSDAGSSGADGNADDDGSDGGSSSGAAGSSSDGGAVDGGEVGSSGAAESSGGGQVGPTYDYGQCNDGCPADMCITIDGFDGSFCTTPCEDGACPQPTEGNASGQCLLGPDLMLPPVNCVLTCSVAGQNCPTGMTCVDAMMGADAGICLWQQ